MATAGAKRLKKIIGKKAKIDWEKVAEGERLRRRLIVEGFVARGFHTPSRGHGRRARIVDDTENDRRTVIIRRSY